MPNEHDFSLTDFSKADRKPSCLETDFPIAQIDQLSQVEGNAGKPIYQMSKWWARRRSCIFRTMLLAAAMQCPDESDQAAKLVWENYYKNHQTSGVFSQLHVLDCFMGGGTTLVEGSRLGMHMTGIDLNPVAWFVVKNELAKSDPDQVKKLFAEIEKQVKPRLQPFYTTTCPRGHKGKWIDVQSGEESTIDPLTLTPEERAKYRWEGPEIIYTFWAKHGTCNNGDCHHRTPLFRSPVVAEKELSTSYIELTCPKCGTKFHLELGETRIAPNAERVVLESEFPFTEMSQSLAKLFNDYDQGSAQETWERVAKIVQLLPQEPACKCPECGTFAADKILNIAQVHERPITPTNRRKKKDYAIQKKKVKMTLLVHPKWLSGTPAFLDGRELGGFAGAEASDSEKWYEQRLENLRLIEVRGATSKNLPESLTLSDGTEIHPQQGTTVAKSGVFTCQKCGSENVSIEAMRATNHTAPVAVYALQCHCPQCEAEGYQYSGRYFKAPDPEDIRTLSCAEQEWQNLSQTTLKPYFPDTPCKDSFMFFHCGNIHTDRGYTHWWKMFNPRQLLVHATLLQAIMILGEKYPLDIREHALDTFLQYLKCQSMFAFWFLGGDVLVPMLLNNNFHPKNLTVENNVFHKIGRGNWKTSCEQCLEGVKWMHNPWDLRMLPENSKAKSEKIFLHDPVQGGRVCCGHAGDMSFLGDEQFDLIVTDPPFGNNVYYADLADFFYVWLRIPMLKWYAGKPEAKFFEAERTPHALEAIDNPLEHPDVREDYEKKETLDRKILETVQEITGNYHLQVKNPNPLYQQPTPSEVYMQLLSECWSAAYDHLRDSGLLAFTFHHSKGQMWINILQSLFEANFVLVATYPIQSEETKGEGAAFGAKQIEYDIIHVCQKRVADSEQVSWADMRRWVYREGTRLKNLLEQTHGRTLSPASLRVILQGKCLEFYSQHYEKVIAGNGTMVDVQNVLQNLEEMLNDLMNTSQTPLPNAIDPVSRLFLEIFRSRSELPRDDLHKSLFGLSITASDLEERGWIETQGTTVCKIPLLKRFEVLWKNLQNNQSPEYDLDQAVFCVGAILNGVPLEENFPRLALKPVVQDILQWEKENHWDSTREKENHWDSTIKKAASDALELLTAWTQQQNAIKQQSSVGQESLLTKPS